MSAPDRLRAEIGRAAQTLGAAPEFVAVVERPRDPSFGEWATNAAMMLAKPLGIVPREVASRLIAANWQCIPIHEFFGFVTGHMIRIVWTEIFGPK